MKKILIVYPDESYVKSSTNCRQTHYDLSIIQFFNRLQKEKQESLYFIKTGKKKLKRSDLGRLEYLDVNLIVSYPEFSEIEHYALQRGVPYFTFDHFSQGSSYLDRFWLFNSQSINTFEESNTYPLSPGILSPLLNQSAYYARFLPIPQKSADAFYKKGKKICLILIDNVFKRTDENNLVGQIMAILRGHSQLFGSESEVIFYGREKAILRRMAVSLKTDMNINVNVLHDNFHLNENCVYSMLQKSDLILSCNSRYGVDALVFKKPIIFVGTENLLFKELNNLINDCSKWSDLKSLGQRQHEFLSNFIAYLEQNCLMFANVSYNSNELYKRLCKVVVNQKKERSEENTVSSTHARKEEGGKNIVAEHVDFTLKLKRIFLACRRLKKEEEKKFAKLLRNPHAFFRDSQFRLFRFIGLCLSKIK